MMGKQPRSLRVTIDNQAHLVAPGTSVLDAARVAGINVPTLCHLDGCKPPSSCMVCLVKDVKTGANLPACATEVVDGMQLESETEEVRALRRTAIELLLSDHVGDCLAPCTLACPLHPDIPSVIRLIRVGKIDQAAQLLRRQLPLAPLLEWLCAKPCEKACRRGRYDRSVAIGTLHQEVATQTSCSTPKSQELKAGTVAIIGGGMTGLSAAHFLNRLGYAVTIFEQHDQLGGRLREEMVLAGLTDEVLESELQHLENLGVTFKLRTPIALEVFETLLEQFDVILVTCGPSARNFFGDKLDHAACFIAGDAVKPNKSTLRRAVSGRDVAIEIDEFLSGSALAAGLAENSTFSVRLGKLSEAELDLFAKEVAKQGTENAPSELDEAGRCFLCDCSDLANCKLRQYAIQYGADPRRYHDKKTQRRELVREHTPSGITFESGKCIRCGRCVEIVRQDPDAAGLTFVGRGFEAMLSPPIGCNLDEALGKMAEACCEACPTGALVNSK